MNFDEAIEIGTNYLKGSDEAEPVEFNKFVQLGVEALIFLRRWRDKAEIKPFPLLPSETTD